jgi:hypothetical protein
MATLEQALQIRKEVINDQILHLYYIAADLRIPFEWKLPTLIELYLHRRGLLKIDPDLRLVLTDKELTMQEAHIYEIGISLKNMMIEN